MNNSLLIKIILISVIIIYIIIQLMNFYDIGQESYGIYLGFIIFIILSIIILPNSYPKIK
jgi:hypothetical protein